MSTIEVTSEPEGSDVYIDGEYQGKTPLEKSVPPDEYIVTVESEEDVQSKKIVVEEDEIERIEFDLEKKDYSPFIILGTGASVLIAFVAYWGYRKSKKVEEKNEKKKNEMKIRED